MASSNHPYHSYHQSSSSASPNMSSGQGDEQQYYGIHAQYPYSQHPGTYPTLSSATTPQYQQQQAAGYSVVQTASYPSAQVSYTSLQQQPVDRSVSEYGHGAHGVQTAATPSSPYTGRQTPVYNAQYPYPHNSSHVPVSPHSPRQAHAHAHTHTGATSTNEQLGMGLHRRRPSSSSTHGSQTVSPGDMERFPCGKCDKTFSRAHDRKRHCETQHSSSPPVHRCQFCAKAFSRHDSLKRHQDNGCDKDPSFSGAPSA